jgi:hypothetical protein
MPMEPKKKLNVKTAALGAVGALVLAGAIALVSNAERVCAAVENPIGRAICQTVVETAQQARDDEQLPEHESFDGGDGL